MKKPTRKVVLRRETIRVLTNVDLAHSVGGADSGDACPIRALVATPTQAVEGACAIPG